VEIFPVMGEVPATGCPYAMTAQLLPLFVEISVETPDWEARLEMLILHREPIRYRHDELPALPEKFHQLLTRHRYARYSDWTTRTAHGIHHFLIPL
jgi:hypothetical protein